MIRRDDSQLPLVLAHPAQIRVVFPHTIHKWKFSPSQEQNEINGGENVVAMGSDIQALVEQEILRPLQAITLSAPSSTATAIYLGYLPVRSKPSAPEEQNETADSAIVNQIGCLVRVLSVDAVRTNASTSAQLFRLAVRGICRFRVEEVTQKAPFVVARIKLLHDAPVSLTNDTDPSNYDDPELRSLAKQMAKFTSALLQSIQQRLRLPSQTVQLLDRLFHTSPPGHVADLLAHIVNLDVEKKLALLQSVDVKERVRLLLQYLGSAQLGDDLVHDSFIIVNNNAPTLNQTNSKSGSRRAGGNSSASVEGNAEEMGELQQLEQKLKSVQLPSNVEIVAQREMKRLQKMNPMQAEYNIIRHYLEWLSDLPWAVAVQDRLDIQAAKDQLEKDHYGLDKVKTRIIEYLAVRKLKQDMKGPILCLVGPPGVGKTSLGKSIAAALERPFHRIALGGVHDVAEIKGHRRTYIGSLPGSIIHGLKTVKAKNPVFLLDEVDKLGRDTLRGDPTAALLEVLDPEQNHQYTDHFLNVPFDLSQVLFITTANQLDTIPAPLLDRMEIVRLPGYTFEEKLNIANNYILPKQIDAHGLKKEDLEIKDDVLLHLITGYTREPGVRSLERELAAVCRSVALETANSIEKTGKRAETVLLDEKSIENILGPARYDDDPADQNGSPGIVNGLSWTSSGSGSVLTIEATCFAGRGVLYLTGKLGDVLRESAQTALSWVRSNADLFVSHRIPRGENLSRMLPGPLIASDSSPITGHIVDTDQSLQKLDIHVHLPAGAIPKDGPSAGIALTTCLVSLLTGKPVRPLLAMTGEVTLHGRVLPVGGIKEKVLAAHRANIKCVILPEKNHKDVLVDIPESVKRDMEFVYVQKVEDVLRIALGEEIFKSSIGQKGKSEALSRL